MPVREGVRRARVAQLIILLLNYLCLIMATLSFGHTIFQFGELVYEVAYKTKLQIPEKTQYESEKRMLEESMLIRYALYCGLGVVVAVILFTILNMIAAVTEGRKLLILTLVLGSLITAASLSAAVLMLLAKLKANSILAIVFDIGMKKFHHLYEKDVIYYQRVVDTIQTTGMCCGYDSYKDYKTIYNQIRTTKDNNETFTSCRSTSGLGSLQVPLSCCKNIESTKGIFDDCATQIFENPCSSDASVKVPANIYTRGCKHNISGTSGHLDVLSGLYMATFVLCISICILLFLLLRDVQDVTEFHLPPVEEMQQMGLGQDTIRVLFKAEKGAEVESAVNSAMQGQQAEQQ